VFAFIYLPIIILTTFTQIIIEKFIFKTIYLP
jgi:hypothetical protein